MLFDGHISASLTHQLASNRGNPWFAASAGICRDGDWHNLCFELFGSGLAGQAQAVTGPDGAFRNRRVLRAPKPVCVAMSDSEHWQVILLAASAALPMVSLIVMVTVIYG